MGRGVADQPGVGADQLLEVRPSYGYLVDIERHNDDLTCIDRYM